MKFSNEITTEYHATIILDLIVHLFLKNDECTGINYRQLQGILWLLAQHYK